jgi:hypothetical protein
VVDGLGQQGIASPGDAMGEFDFLSAEPAKKKPIAKKRSQAEPVDPKYKTAARCFTVLLGLFIVGTLANHFGLTGGPDEVQASIDARDVVRGMLKSPSTASFPWEYSANRWGKNGFTIKSYVDAQNGFGATVRTQWLVRLRYTSKDEYEVVDAMLY